MTAVCGKGLCRNQATRFACYTSRSGLRGDGDGPRSVHSSGEIVAVYQSCNECGGPPFFALDDVRIVGRPWEEVLSFARAEKRFRDAIQARSIAVEDERVSDRNETRRMEATDLPPVESTEMPKDEEAVFHEDDETVMRMFQELMEARSTVARLRAKAERLCKQLNETQRNLTIAIDDTNQANEALKKKREEFAALFRVKGDVDREKD